MAASPRAHPHLRVLVFLHAHLCLASALSFSYNFSIPGTSAELRFINDSSPYSDRVDLTIRNKRNSTGRAFHPQPVRLWDRRTGKTASFNTSFSFAISSNPNTTPGDGMAFFIGPFPATLPPDSVGSFLGLFNNPRLTTNSSPPTVAVEFDTFRNTDWDPQDVAADHMGIDVNSIRSSVYTTGLRKGDLNGTMSANVNYNGSSKVMVVTLQLASGTIHSIQSTVDFRDAGLPQDVAVGFSAATGAAVESHQVLSWSFSSTDPTSNKIPLWAIILLSAAASALAALAAAVLCVIMRREQRRRPIDQIDLPVAREFSYNELSAATSNFSQDRWLGEGAFGEVYKGELQAPNKRPVAVAVKRLTRLLEQTRRDYVTEIMTLGQLSHKNLVNLVGWCNGGGGGDTPLLLVYELVTNGNLHEHLHGSSQRLLTWAERYKIVRGIGSAIEYLHTGKQNPILHRDIKPSNVMLDDELEAKLGDFGLVRQVESGQSSLGGTVMIGTKVYMDPVCISTNTVSTASDVYSFGVLLLEIATGLEPTEVQGPGGLLSNNLVSAVQEFHGRGSVLEMADKRLNGKFDDGEMERVLLVGLSCVQQDRRDRPEIRVAVNNLPPAGSPLFVPALNEFTCR